MTHTMNTPKMIANGMIVRMDHWPMRKSALAQIRDMGAMEDYKDMVTDEDRVYASCRTMFLSDDPAYYEADDREWGGPVTTLTDGEIVRLYGTVNLYKVVDMRPRGWEYISDPIHFELVK